MFSFTGLKPEHVDALAQKAHIYMTRDGELSRLASHRLPLIHAHPQAAYRWLRSTTATSR